ncbi:MAG: rRNA adenine N-6-methyltransferase family protein [Micropruina sp.]|uniref:rRNA adenine N-6-methyltransferase family protein n=1 Tax=Micropruina sp. TaxID=2737536 RepID=UPI0039E3066C
MPRSLHGGWHEPGQNFLTHKPSIDTITTLVAGTRGPILELGAGDGALTRPLAESGRPLTAIDLNEHRVRRLARALPGVRVVHADALNYPVKAPVVVGNVPFHLTTPILRRLLNEPRWAHAILVTQWEVARKRAGVGGHTMTALRPGRATSNRILVVIAASPHTGSSPNHFLVVVGCLGGPGNHKKPVRRPIAANSTGDKHKKPVRARVAPQAVGCSAQTGQVS